MSVDASHITDNLIICSKEYLVEIKNNIKTPRLCSFLSEKPLAIGSFTVALLETQVGSTNQHFWK